MPTPFITETFVGTDGATLESVSGFVSVGGAVAKISGNKAYFTTGGAYYHSTVPTYANQQIKSNLSAGTTQPNNNGIGLHLRASYSTTFTGLWLLYAEGASLGTGTWKVYDVLNNAFTLLGSDTHNQLNGGKADSVTFQVLGNQASFTTTGADGTFTVGPFTTSTSQVGQVGIYSYASSTNGFLFGSFNAYTSNDSTAPVVASASVDSTGTTLTINYTETGSPPVLPASGVTGFQLGGTSFATISGGTINGLIGTYTVTGTILPTDILKLHYVVGNVTDSANIPNALATAYDIAVTNNVVLPAIPGTPTSLTTTLDAQGNINFNWVAGSGTATSYTIQYDYHGSLVNSSPTMTIAAGTISSPQNPFEPNTIYDFHILASNSGGNSAYSSIASVTTAALAISVASSPLSLSMGIGLHI